MTKRPGFASEERAFNLRLAPGVYEYLRRHAFERNISMNRLVSDIMRLWIIAATDPTDPMFSSRALGYAIPKAPEEAYPGYTEGLVFVVPKEDQSG